MSKRKRSTPKESTSGSPSEGEPGVHLSPDVLAGSPDVFAPGKDKAAEPAQTPEPEAVTPDVPADEAAPEKPAETVTETPAVETEEPAPAAAADVEAPPPPPPAPYQPHAPAYVAPSQPSRRPGTSVALGVVLVVLGLFALLVQFTGFDAGGSWPLFVVIPGLTLLLVGFLSLGTGALIPGAILTVIGLILAYMNATQDWPAWAFAWPLVAPGGVGLGIWLQGLRTSDAHLLRQGRVLMFVAALIFMIGFVIFGTIFRISETDYGWFGKAALPALLIIIGIVLLARSIQRSRQT
jgi:hypothetical protein